MIPYKVYICLQTNNAGNFNSRNIHQKIFQKKFNPLPIIMKYIFILLFPIILSIGCKPKVLSGIDLENKLKETMAAHLDKVPHPGIEFKIKNVTYFPETDKKDYICQFEVDMQYKDRDTTGIMKAVITNDFKDVQRFQ